MYRIFLLGSVTFTTMLFASVCAHIPKQDVGTASDKTYIAKADTLDAKSLEAEIDSLNAAMDSLHLATEADKKTCITEDSVDREVYVDIKDLQRKVIYPNFAKRWAIEGKVWVRVLIGEDGIPKKYFIESTDSPLLNNAAVSAVMNTSFSAAILNKQPVCCWVMLPIVFRLR